MVRLVPSSYVNRIVSSLVHVKGSIRYDPPVYSIGMNFVFNLAQFSNIYP